MPRGEVTSEMRLRTLLSDAPRDALDALVEEGLVTIPCHGLKSRLDWVDDLLAVAPDLAAIVHTTVGAIHPLSAPPGYDVSHSQPRWRDRIFVSFPECTDEFAALRLAESVVHEAMHLHLTNEETRTPLVAAMSRTTHSPWRGTARAVQGVLHGVFVFSCIHCLLSAISRRRSVGEGEQRHIRGRLKNIERELAEVDLAALEAALTSEGALRLRSWKMSERAEARY